MALRLGIDTGGTYTDAVLYDDEGVIVHTAKSLTTREDLSLGIGAALERVLPADRSTIAFVSISTTLATNALVEGHGAPIGLVLIGQRADALHRAGLGEALAGDPVIFASGGHDGLGEERAPLDTVAVARGIEGVADRVSAFAVASLFAVRNPTHELAARDIVRGGCRLPVTCSHELSSRLDAPRRALTAVLNARLIGLLTHLLDAVSAAMVRERVDAPLMVVKGDGSLIGANLATVRPVETILSGPAASVVGARELAGVDDVLVVDMGGTTSDIALLNRGYPRIRDDGALVGGWRTMVEAVSVHTVGLGGDSEVRLSSPGECRIGPRRVVPLSLLAHQAPGIVDAIEARSGDAISELDQAQLAMRIAAAPQRLEAMPRFEREIWAALADGPRWRSEVAEDLISRRALQRMVRAGIVGIAGFTPTDAAHVLGWQRSWSHAAAISAAELWRRLGVARFAVECHDVREFCEWVVDAVIVAMGHAVVDAVLAEEQVPLSVSNPASRAVMDRALNPDRANPDHLLDLRVKLRRNIVAVGAPAMSYFPRIAGRLGVEVTVPANSEVANAVGAVASRVMQVAKVLVTSPGEGHFRVHADDGITDFSDEAAAVEDAGSRAAASATRKARAAGAVGDLRLETRRDDVRAPGLGDLELFIETVVTVTAFGPPRRGGDFSRGQIP